MPNRGYVALKRGMANHDSVLTNPVRQVTVVATAECYAINAEEFKAVFANTEEAFRDMREQCVLTSFAMYKPPTLKGLVEEDDRHSEFGVPLYM